MCEKLCFDSYPEAEKVIITAKSIRRRSSNRHRAQKIPVRAYKCPECGKYHLTSKKKVNKTKRYK